MKKGKEESSSLLHFLLWNPTALKKVEKGEGDEKISNLAFGLGHYHKRWKSSKMLDIILGKH